MIQQDAYRKLAAVRDEYHAARFSLAETLGTVNVNPETHHASKQQRVTFGQLELCVKNLQITYLARLFAEFEGVLRDYWCNGCHKRTRPAMETLMDRLAAYRTVHSDDLHDAHEVRDYRNDVIHHHLQDPRFDLLECQSRLARYVRWLPLKW
jgi:hypothetical protein